MPGFSNPWGMNGFLDSTPESSARKRSRSHTPLLLAALSSSSSPESISRQASTTDPSKNPSEQRGRVPPSPPSLAATPLVGAVAQGLSPSPAPSPAPLPGPAHVTQTPTAERIGESKRCASRASTRSAGAKSSSGSGTTSRKTSQTALVHRSTTEEEVVEAVNDQDHDDNSSEGVLPRRSASPPPLTASGARRSSQLVSPLAAPVTRQQASSPLSSSSSVTRTPVLAATHNRLAALTHGATTAGAAVPPSSSPSTPIVSSSSLAASLAAEPSSPQSPFSILGAASQPQQQQQHREQPPLHQNFFFAPGCGGRLSLLSGTAVQQLVIHPKSPDGGPAAAAGEAGRGDQADKQLHHRGSGGSSSGSLTPSQSAKKARTEGSGTASQRHSTPIEASSSSNSSNSSCKKQSRTGVNPVALTPSIPPLPPPPPPPKLQRDTITAIAAETVAVHPPALVSAEEAESMLRALQQRQASQPPCPQAHGGSRYRDAAGYYCTYCTYSVCEECFRRVPGALMQLPPTHGSDDNEDEEEGEGQVQGGRGTRVTALAEVVEDRTPVHPAITSGGGGGSSQALATAAEALQAILSTPATAVVLTPAATPGVKIGTRVTGGGGGAEASTVDTAAASATAHRRPLLPRCHLCTEGYLKREEVVLHAWACEGPAPEPRVRRRGRLVFDTEVIQRFYFIKEQRERREASTEPLVAHFHGSARLNGWDGDDDGGGGDGYRSETGDANNRKQQEEVVASGKLLVTPRKRRNPAVAVAAAGGLRVVESEAPSMAAMTLADPSGTTNDNSNGLQRHSHRVRPCCEEGGRFVFSVANPRPEQPCVWCVVNRHPRDSNPAFTGGGCPGSSTGTVTPVLSWRCPPSLPGLSQRRYAVTVPYASYGLHNVHALALYLTADIFRKVQTHLTNSGGGGGGHLATAMVVPSQHAQPLLVVDVLHRIAASPRIDARLLNSSLLPNNNHNKRMSHGIGGRGRVMHHHHQQQQQQLYWPDGLACEELAMCVDQLLQGRSVAVGGVGSKHFFLSHVASAAELLPLAVFTVDASRGRAATAVSGGGGGATSSSHSGSVARQLREIGRQVHELARAPLTALTAATTGTAANGDPDHRLERPRDDDGTDGIATGKIGHVPRQLAPPLLESLPMAPLPAGSGHTDVSSAEGLRIHFPIVSLQRTPNSHSDEDERDAAAAVASVVGTAACTIRPPVVAFASAAARAAVLAIVHGNGSISNTLGEEAMDPYRRRRRCVRWLTLPSSTASALPTGESGGSSGGGVAYPPSVPHCHTNQKQQQQQAAAVLIIHSADLLGAEAEATLLQLCRELGAPRPALRLLLSYDDPLWPAGGSGGGGALSSRNAAASSGGGGGVASLSSSPSSTLAAGLEHMSVVSVQLRSLLLPRVHEMRLVNSLALLTHSEAAAAGGGGGGGSGGGGATTAATSAGGGVGASSSCGGGGALPLHDTIRRVLLSIPSNYHGYLIKMIAVQDHYGDGALISLHAVKAELERDGAMVNPNVMKSIVRELASGRLVAYDSAEHAIVVPQHRKLKRLLEEIMAQQQSGGGGGSGP